MPASTSSWASTKGRTCGFGPGGGPRLARWRVEGRSRFIARSLAVEYRRRLLRWRPGRRIGWLPRFLLGVAPDAESVQSKRPGISSVTRDDDKVGSFWERTWIVPSPFRRGALLAISGNNPIQPPTARSYWSSTTCLNVLHIAHGETPRKGLTKASQRFPSSCSS